MNYTKAKIYNMTLKNLGVTIGVQSTEQTDRNTVVLNEYYETAKEKTLTDHDWSFASSYRQLALTGNNSPNPKFNYEYDYPNNCVRIREILNSQNEQEVPFEISSTSNGQRVIYTSQPNASVRYTRLVNEETFFTPEFAMALSWYLAFLSAKSITGARTNTSDCLQIYRQMLIEARVADSNEQKKSDDNVCDWIEARE